MENFSTDMSVFFRPKFSRRRFSRAVHDLKHPLRSYRKWQAIRQATAQRYAVFLKLGALAPAKLHQAGGIWTAQGYGKVLTRHQHVRTGRFQFSLHHSNPGVDGHLLVCLNRQTRLAYALWVPVQDCPSHVSFTLSEARQQAVKVFRY